MGCFNVWKGGAVVKKKCSNCYGDKFSIWEQIEEEGKYKTVALCEYCGLTADIEGVKEENVIK